MSRHCILNRVNDCIVTLLPDNFVIKIVNRVLSTVVALVVVAV